MLRLHISSGCRSRRFDARSRGLEVWWAGLKFQRVAPLILVLRSRIFAMARVSEIGGYGGFLRLALSAAGPCGPAPVVRTVRASIAT